jgi:SAM-dependent methyltransferase
MTAYWDHHYADFNEDSPSPFCTKVAADLLLPTDSVVELGCGNGRDGLALVRRADFYTGVDLSANAIQSAGERFLGARIATQRYSLTVGDFSKVNFATLEASRLVVYSRFSLHADSEVAENALLDHLAEYDLGPILVCIEARTIFDELYEQGELMERNTYMTDHYRRFIVPDEFKEKVDRRFTVNSFEVERGFAPYGSEDPIVMRVVFSRKS